jgi:integrase
MRGDGRIFRRSGSAFYWCAYYLRGKQYRQSTEETDEKKAKKFLNRKVKEVHADEIGARPFVGPQQQRITVSELLDALEADYKLRGKDSRQVKTHLKSIREHFGDWRAVAVTAEAVDAFITGLLESGKAPATVNRSTQLLSQAFNLAIERRRLSMAPHIRHLSERGNARQGFFADWEFRAVVGNLPGYLKDFAWFGYLTGWRRGEIASLRWEDVDGDVIRLRGENSKNGEARSITLDGELAELMERRKTARQVKTDSAVILCDLVFHHDGQPIVDFRKAWATACVANGLGAFYCRDCRDADGKYISVLDAMKKCSYCGRKCEKPKYIGKLFHDFRRTAVRNMVRAGVPERVAMSISGHKTRSIFDRYNIVSERDLRDAMQRTQTYLIATAEEEAKRQQVVRMQ